MKKKDVRVFIVDDSAVARLGLRRLLRREEGIHVVGEAPSGEAALRRIPEVEIDVVLMDVVLPGIDGIEATRRLMASCPRPILVVSELAERDAELGFIGETDAARRWQGLPGSRRHAPGAETRPAHGA